MIQFFKKIIVLTVFSLLLFQIAPYQTNANISEKVTETQQKKESETFFTNQHDESIEVTNEKVNVENKEKLRGIAIAKPTNVYSNTDRNSKIVKTYKPGDILEFYNYDNNWFITTISMNGSTQFGFIHSKDVETAVSPTKQVKQVVPKQTIYAYETASTQSKKLNYKAIHTDKS